MRTALLFVLVVLVVSACVDATSPPNCQNVKCSETKCGPVQCSCGSYKDACGCCDFCFKCPGDVCTPLFQERCSDGHTCLLDQPGSVHFGGKGKCKPLPSS
ncbi:8.6 kDa transglutaminase substrate-like [Amblyomma americanum]